LPTSTNTLPPPTNTPSPTSTPIPPTSTPKPILLTGSGDSVQDINNPYDVSLIHVVGNSCSGFFAVESYGSNNEKIDLLVNTTDPYDGIRPMDFRVGQHTTRFQINASCAWQIQIYPLSAAHIIQVPGNYSGKGDDVLSLIGSQADTAKITGNANSSFFAVTGYGENSDLLVNTTDPYEGTVIISAGIKFLEIQASSDWSITITSR